MSARFPGLVIRDWQTRLVNDHPRVFPDARLVQTLDGPALACSGWPDVPEGWRTIVETVCRRLEQAVAAEPEAELAVLDIKQKWGGLRLLVASTTVGAEAHDAITLAVDLAEARSICVCEQCGRPGRLAEQSGWYATRCEEHSEGFAPVRARDPNLQVTTRFVDGQPVQTARRYVGTTDSFVAVSVSDDMD
jgi:hypothetical protein